MPPPLTREADLLDQKLQRLGGHVAGGLLATLGLAGAAAWVFWGQGELPLVALGPPVGLMGAGVAVVVWSRGIDVLPDPDLPVHADLPPTDPRMAQPLATRRSRWVWAVTVWVCFMVVSVLGTWLSKDAAPGWLRGIVFLGATLPLTLWGARWLEAANGESSWPKL
jgi:hypothetical protein